MDIQKITITPALAREYLTHNTKNRKIKSGVITKYATDIAYGRWQESPEPISFYEDGTLRDGQHRLLAIIRANTPVQMYVAFDVPNDSVICDQNVTRTLPDILNITGKLPALANNVAAGCINFLLNYSPTGGTAGRSSAVKMRFAEENYEKLATAVSICVSGAGGAQITRKAPICAAIFCALHYRVDQRVLERFVTVLNSGHQADPSEDAAIVARNQLILDFKNRTGGFNAQKQIFAVICQAIADFQVCRTRKKKYNVSADLPIWKRANAEIISKYRGEK